MNLQRLEEFVTIVRCQSIKDAAKQLGVSPSTLSSRLSAFEKSLGTPLFTRSTNGLSLTSSGLGFYEEAKKISLHYSALKQNIQEYDKLTNYNCIRIGVIGGEMPFYLGPFLDIINKRQPDIQLELFDESSYSIQDGLLQNKLDLVFAPVMPHITFDGIVRRPLYGASQSVILPLSHPLATHRTVSLKELNGETFLLHPKSAENCIRDFQLSNLNAAKIQFSIYENESTLSFYKFLIPVGKGIAILPIQIPSEVPNSIILPLTDVVYTAPVSLFYKKDVVNTDVLQFINEFIRFVKEASSHEH